MMKATVSKSKTGQKRQLSALVEINKILQNNAEFVCNQWLEGELLGKEYKAINPTRIDSTPGSFSINIQTGVWADFATNDKGADFVSLYCYIKGVDGKEAVKRLQFFIKKQGLTVKQQSHHQVKRKKPKPPTEPLKEEDLVELPPDSHPEKGLVINQWEWRNQENEIVFYTCRLEPELGKKEVLPVRYVLSKNRWHWSYPDGNFPLMNAPDIERGVHVIFSEGEKTYRHLSQFKGYVSTTTAGGSGRLFETDLSPLKNAVSVAIFPDADQPGVKYASQVMAYCIIHKIDVTILDVVALGWINGQDAADFPDIAWPEYQSHLIDLDTWVNQSVSNRNLFDNAVLQVAAQLSPVEYDRGKAHIAKVLDIGRRTLDSEVKPLRKVQSESTVESEPKMSPEELEEYRESIYSDIAHLAESENILSEVLNFAHDTLELVGENNLIVTTYLTITSRLLPKPISTLVKGASSSGKSFNTRQVTEMFPKTAYYQFTAASAKALIYTDEDFQHRILIIAEASQLNGADDNDMLSMLIRTLLSEGSIKYEVTIKDPLSNEQTTQVITKEGPTGLLLTTTADVIHHENETRMLSIFSDESESQTKAIVRQAARAEARPHINENIEAQLEIWRKFHDWISLGNHKVAIPFMPTIIESIERMPVRFRRDLTNMLPALIKTSTIIHQQHRETNSHGYLIATLDDYEIIRSLADTALARETDASGSPREMTILKHIYDLMSENVRKGNEPLMVSTRKIATALGIAQKTVSYQINKAIEHGYLTNMQLVPNRAMKLKLGADFDIGKIQLDSILPSVEQVKEIMKNTS